MSQHRMTWLFDLDNTLHNANPHIFPHINQAMTAYIQQHLRLNREEAQRIRQLYWHRYGATLLGLMRHHQVDPHHFLQETHNFTELAPLLVFDRALKAQLKKLPGRKLIYSNAPIHYTEDILKLMGIRSLFSTVYAIEHTRFQPKPSVSGFRRLLHQAQLIPERCIMVEDSLPNLLTARTLGLRTVWISRSTRTPAHVDIRLPSILMLPHHLGRLGIHR